MDARNLVNTTHRRHGMGQQTPSQNGANKSISNAVFALVSSFPTGFFPEDQVAKTLKNAD